MIFDVECDWAAEPEVRRFALSDAQLAAIAPDVVGAALQGTVEQEGAWRWRGATTRSTRGLLFDQCSLLLEVIPTTDVTAADVRASLSFDSGAWRVVGVTWLALAGFTLPLAHAWRDASLQSAHRFTRDTLDRLWQAISSAAPTSPYR